MEVNCVARAAPVWVGRYRIRPGGGAADQAVGEQPRQVVGEV